MFLKCTNRNRFAQTASIGFGRAFAPCAEDKAAAPAHPPPGGAHVMVEVIEGAGCTPDRDSWPRGRRIIFRTVLEGGAQKKRA